MKIKLKTMSKEIAEIKEIFEASKQVKGGKYYTGDLRDIIKEKRKGELIINQLKNKHPKLPHRRDELL